MLSELAVDVLKTYSLSPLNFIIFELASIILKLSCQQTIIVESTVLSSEYPIKHDEVQWRQGVSLENVNGKFREHTVP
jgi:hypothetical protein